MITSTTALHRRLTVLALAVAACASIPLFPTAGDEGGPGRPLRNEDVVRMLVAGRSAAEVIDRIRASETDFDLCDDMLQELTLARVPVEVVQAMRERQARMEKPPAAVPSSGPGTSARLPGRVTLEVAIGGDEARREGEGRLSIVLSDEADDSLARALQLGPSSEERAIRDIAIFLACRTPDHVPDQWRSQSPLGRDFVAMRRHQMLAFVPGAVPARTRAGGGRARRAGDRPPTRGSLELILPRALEAEVEPGVAHDLTIGIAIEVGGHFLALTTDERDAVVAGAGGLKLAARLTTAARGSPVGVALAFEGEAPPPAGR